MSCATGATVEFTGSAAMLPGSSPVDVANDSDSSGLLVSGTAQVAGNITGTGTTQVGAGSDLTAGSIVQGALIIGGDATHAATVTIAATENGAAPALLYWDGGTGTWNSTNTNWSPYSTGGSDVVWDNADVAMFGANGAGSIVTVASGIAAHEIQFLDTGYQLTGGDLTLTSGIAVATGVEATISSELTGSSGLEAFGNGTLTIAGASTYTGPTDIGSGTTLKIANPGALGGSNLIFSARSTSVLDLNGSDLSSSTAVIDLFMGKVINSDTGTPASFGGNFNDATYPVSLPVNIDGPGDITLGGILAGDAGLNKSGSGKLTLAGDNTYTGPTDVVAGTLEVNDYVIPSAVTVESGATLQGNGSGGTGPVTVSPEGNYLADVYRVTIVDSALQLAGAAAGGTTSGSLDFLSGSGNTVWALSPADAAYRVLGGSATVGGVSYGVSPDDSSPSFRYHDDFTYTDGTGTHHTGPAMVLDGLLGPLAIGFSNYYFRVIFADLGRLLASAVCIPCQTTAIGAVPGASDSSASAVTAGGSLAATGQVAFSAGGGLSDDFGTTFGQAPIWTNVAAESAGNNGSGVAVAQLPQLLALDATTVAFTDGTVTRWFDKVGDDYVERYGYQDVLSDDTDAHQFTLTDPTGQVLQFDDFDGSWDVAARGGFVSSTDRAGNAAEVYEEYAAGVPETIRVHPAAGGDAIDEYVYAYDTSSPAAANQGLLSSVTLQRSTDGGSTFTPVQQAAYTYYGDGSVPEGAADFGNPGDLLLAQTFNYNTTTDSYELTDTNYFRYYVADGVDTESHSGYANGLEYMFSNVSYYRLVESVGGDPSDALTAANADVAAYADEFLQYNSARQVTQIVADGAGCSVCSQGQGTFTYEYTPSGNAPGYNNWSTETVETLLDADSNPVYVNTTFSNFAGQTLLQDHFDPAASQDWDTLNQYDPTSGLLTETALPSAVADYDSGAANLGVTYTHAGIIDVTVYYTENGTSNTLDTSSATSTDSLTPGGAAGYVAYHAIKNGDGGTPILQDFATYYLVKSSADGIPVAEVASSSVFSAANDVTTIADAIDFTSGDDSDTSGVETTTYGYEFYDGTTQVYSLTTTLPSISADEPLLLTHTDTTTDVFDAMGRVIWQRDALGYLTYAAYDTATGAMTTLIQDVNTGEDFAGEYANKPDGWETPEIDGAGLNLITTFVNDDLGRPVIVVTPENRVTFTVFDDPDHEVRTYSGWIYTPGDGGYTNPDNYSIPEGEVAPPVQVEIDDLPVSAEQSGDDLAGTYSALLTMDSPESFAASDFGGVALPVGGESIAAVDSLSLEIANQAGQVVESRDFYSLTGLTDAHITSGDILGDGTQWTPGASDSSFGYYSTTFAYNDMGLEDRVVNGDGTITRVIDNAEGEVTSVWLGAGGWSESPDDAPEEGQDYWTTAHPDNMVEVSAFVYDNGGVGDGNLTGQLLFPDGASYSNVQDTAMFYNWQDELVATKSGLLLNSDWTENFTGETSDGVDRPLVVDTLDNLGDVVEEQTYRGDGVAVSTATGAAVFTAPTGVTFSNLLRAETTIDYDPQNRRVRNRRS